MKTGLTALSSFPILPALVCLYSYLFSLLYLNFANCCKKIYNFNIYLCLDTVEVLYPGSTSWTFTTPLPQFRYEYDSASWQYIICTVCILAVPVGPSLLLSPSSGMTHYPVLEFYMSTLYFVLSTAFSHHVKFLKFQSALYCITGNLPVFHLCTVQCTYNI